MRWGSILQWWVRCFIMRALVISRPFAVCASFSKISRRKGRLLFFCEASYPSIFKLNINAVILIECSVKISQSIFSLSCLGKIIEEGFKFIWIGLSHYPHYKLREVGNVGGIWALLPVPGIYHSYCWLHSCGEWLLPWVCEMEIEGATWLIQAEGHRAFHWTSGGFFREDLL